MLITLITTLILPGCRIVGSNTPTGAIGDLKDNDTFIAGLPVLGLNL